jgi:DNA-binding response OmpR family regulator
MKNIMVIMITSEAARLNVVKAVKAGATAYIKYLAPAG